MTLTKEQTGMAEGCEPAGSAADHVIEFVMAVLGDYSSEVSDAGRKRLVGSPAIQFRTYHAQSEHCRVDAPDRVRFQVGGMRMFC